MSKNVYERIGARPVINAGGNTTLWGGSTPSPEVMQAMLEAGESFVEMEEVLAASGDHLAKLLGVEAAYPTAGCYAALVLSTAACLTGNNPDKMEQLPDTTGMKDEIVLQQCQRYGYDRAYTVPGSKLVLAGDDNGCTLNELEAAIGPNTAAVAYLVQVDQRASSVSLEDAVDLAHSHGLPAIADAAAQIYPLDYLRRNAQSADLVCFGGKYMGAPHSTGLACGKKDMIEAVTAHGFIGPRPLGRGMKMDRQEIVGLTVAIESWVNADHEQRLVNYGVKFDVIEEALKGASGVKETKVVPTDNFYSLMLNVVLDTQKLGKNAEQVNQELLDGSPRIRLSVADGDDTLAINVHTLNDGEEQTIADRMRDLLA
jgi:L-seryl-tRNA(Ser) seleniumtransferase